MVAVHSARIPWRRKAAADACAAPRSRSSTRPARRGAALAPPCGRRAARLAPAAAPAGRAAGPRRRERTSQSVPTRRYDSTDGPVGCVCHAVQRRLVAGAARVSGPGGCVRTCPRRRRGGGTVPRRPATSAERRTRRHATLAGACGCRCCRCSCCRSCSRARQQVRYSLLFYAPLYGHPASVQCQ